MLTHRHRHRLGKQRCVLSAHAAKASTLADLCAKRAQHTHVHFAQEDAEREPGRGTAGDAASRKRAQPDANGAAAGSPDMRAPGIGGPPSAPGRRVGGTRTPGSAASGRSAPAGASSEDDAAGARVHPAPDDGDAGGAGDDSPGSVGRDPRLQRLRSLLDQSPLAAGLPRLGPGSRPSSGAASPLLGLAAAPFARPSSALGGPGRAAGAEAGLGLGAGGGALGPGQWGAPMLAGGPLGGRAGTPMPARGAGAGSRLSRLAAGNGPYALGRTPLSQRGPPGQRGCVLGCPQPHCHHACTYVAMTRCMTRCNSSPPEAAV